MFAPKKPSTFTHNPLSRTTYNNVQKQPIVTKETTSDQIIRLLKETKESTDEHIYIIGIFLKSDPKNQLFITSSTPFTLHTVNNTNINIKGTNIVFFNATEQIKDIKNIPLMMTDNNNKIIRTRMRDIYKKYNGLSTSQYAECQTISFSNDSNNSNDSNEVNEELILLKKLNERFKKQRDKVIEKLTLLQDRYEKLENNYENFKNDYNRVVEERDKEKLKNQKKHKDFNDEYNKYKDCYNKCSCKFKSDFFETL